MRVARAVAAAMVMAAVATVGGSAGTTKLAAADMQMGGACTTWGISLAISATNSAFDKDCLAAPPGDVFTILFDNKDAVAHNIVILRDHASSETMFRGEVITGPRSVTYSVGPLLAGSYHFHCEVHPTTMMGSFVAGGTAAITSAGMAMPTDAMTSPPPALTAGGAMPEMDDTVRPAPMHRRSWPVRSVLLLIGCACCAGGLLIVHRTRRTTHRAGLDADRATLSSETAASVGVGRRQLVKLGAAGVAGAALTRMATSQSPASAAEHLGGIHLSVFTHAVDPEAVKEFPHHWTLTVYGPDNDLSGMGWGGATDLRTQQDVLNSKMFPCIYSLTGAVEGDVVKVHGLMLFSGGPDQGLPMTFEGNLKTGFLRVNAYNAYTFEGTGLIARI